MWPLGHLVSGYLIYSLGRRVARRPPPSTPSVLALAFGTQFPDLVDKPLAWSLTVLPSGRSLAHSLIVATAVCALATWVAGRYDRRELGVAFAVGYLTHLPGDTVGAFRNGNFDNLSFLLWPVLPPANYTTETSILAHLAKFEFAFTPLITLELTIAGVAFFVWLTDGMPGVDLVMLVPHRLRSALNRW